MFRLGHVSDLHFGNVAERLSPFDDEGTTRSRLALSELLGSGLGTFYPSTFNSLVAQRLLRRLKEELVSLDAIVFTGDLATTGNDPDQALARSYFEGNIPLDFNPINSHPSLLKNPSDILICLPGNHDRYAGLALMPSSRRFEAHFGRHWDFDRDNSYAVLGFTSGRVRVTALQREKTTLFICKADLSLDTASAGEGLTGYIGQGRAAIPAVKELSDATLKVLKHARAAGQDCAAIWAIHFPPHFPNIKSSLELIEPDHLINAAQKCGVGLVLAGHTHKALRYNAANTDPPVEILCSGASAGISDHNIYSFSTIELEVNNGVRSVAPTNFVWNQKKRDFEASVKYPT